MTPSSPQWIRDLSSEILDQPLFFQSQDSSSQEIEFFLKLESSNFSPSPSLSDSSQKKLQIIEQVCRRYLAFHYSYRKRRNLSPSSSLWGKIDPSLRHAPKEWLGFVPVFPSGVVGELTVLFWGQRSNVQVDPIELFSRILAIKPLGFYLFHNHPSGELSASSEDHELTWKVQMVSDIIGLKFLGHGLVSSMGEKWICDISFQDVLTSNQSPKKSKKNFYSSASQRT